MARRNHKGSHVILTTTIHRRNVVGQGSEIVLALALPLLTQEVQACDLLGTRLVGVQDDIVTDAGGWPEAVHSVRLQLVRRDHVHQHGLRIIEQLFGLRANEGIAEYLWILAFQLPSHKERRPIDVLH